MTRVYLADAQPEERSALRLMLEDLKMTIAGEAADWPATLAEAPASRADMLLVDFSLLPVGFNEDLADLRLACPKAVLVVLVSHLDAHQQAALATEIGADALIGKDEMAERVAEDLRLAAGRARS